MHSIRTARRGDRGRRQLCIWRTRGSGFSCAASRALSPPSDNEFENAPANLPDHATRKVSDRIPVYALYVDPPLGRVGLTEAEARAKGHNVRLGPRPTPRGGRAVQKGETQGFM